jgi:hypothetical protein
MEGHGGLNMIVRRRKNDSGIISEWVVIKESDINSDMVRMYWLVDISVGVIIEPWFNGSLNMIKGAYEMEETEETLRQCIGEAMRQTMKEMFEEE